jgi:hypothetical protein
MEVLKLSKKLADKITYKMVARREGDITSLCQYGW